MGDRLVFRAVSDQGSLWVTDGTPEGTRVIWVDPEPSANPRGFAPLGDRLVFGVGPTNESSLWITDGSTAGTRLLKDISTQHIFFTPERFVPFGDRLVFRAFDQKFGYGAWITDGTPEGTQPFMAFMPGLNGVEGPSGFTPFGDRLVFYGHDAEHGRELWITDGTPEGTRLLRDVWPGPAPGTPTVNCVVENLPTIPFSGRIVFVADDGVHGLELWMTDGTPEGTRLLWDIHPGPLTSLGFQVLPDGETFGRSILFPTPDRLYFAADDGVHGLELWALPALLFHRGDPNQDGTTEISDGISIFGFLFLGDPPTLWCKESADVNNDGTIDISDGVFLLNYAFLGGPAPAPPGPPGSPCGSDLDPPGSPGDLGCESYGGCAGN